MTTVQITAEQDTLNLVGQIIDTAGFGYYQQLLSDQIDFRRVETESVPEGMDGLIARNFQSGEIAGLVLARDVLKALQTTAREAIEVLQETEDE